MAASEPVKVEVSADAEALAAARAELAALDDTVFAASPKVSLGRHLLDMRAAVARILGDPALALARISGERPWSLAGLATANSFERVYDAVTVAIADVFTFKVHLDIDGLRSGFAVFVESFGRPAGPPDYRRFIDMVGRLIASLAARRTVGFSAMVQERANRVAGVVLAWPDEVAAATLGAALYAASVKRLTGVDPSIPLPALVLENAAATLRRRPDAASRFRELLQLATLWT